MNQLPVELVTLVCSFMKPRDVGHLRRTSKLYADIGRPFMFRQFHLMFTPQSFRRLKELASNPAWAPLVTSLYYEADTLPFFESFEDWEFHVFDPANFSGSELMPPLDPNSSERARRAYNRDLRKLRQRAHHQYSRPQLRAAYQKYLDYSKVQDKMREDEYHAGKIADAMVRLPNLGELVLSLMGGRSKKLANAYSDSLVIPNGDNSWTEPLGVPQMLSLLQGSARTPMKLKLLHGGVVDWRFFDQSDEVFQDLQKAVGNLQELSLQLSTGIEEGGYSPYGVEDLGVEIDACAEYLKNGRLLKFLSAAPNLRGLDLRFDWSNPNCPTDLKYVVGGHRWEFLADVTLSTFDSTAENLVGFCEKHAMTLQSLVLERIKLVEGSWSPTFQKMRRALHLKHVRICGDLEAFEYDENWSFTTMEAQHETSMSRAVQRYLLQGGDGPLLDLSDYEEETDLEAE
ncbi:hypothetical protein MMC07_000942 [Pseudocyphellaria aurata]|nr:hypothetical protein [Pseudocyphellaria aurata]